MIDRAHARGELHSGEILYCSITYAQSRNLVAHELGHSIGLNHSDRSRDVMSTDWPGGYAFTAAEILVAHLMYQRPARTRFPDNDRNTTGGLDRTGTETILCRK